MKNQKPKNVAQELHQFFGINLYVPNQAKRKFKSKRIEKIDNPNDKLQQKIALGSLTKYS